MSSPYRSNNIPDSFSETLCLAILERIYKRSNRTFRDFKNYNKLPIPIRTLIDEIAYLYTFHPNSNQATHLINKYIREQTGSIPESYKQIPFLLDQRNWVFEY